MAKLVDFIITLLTIVIFARVILSFVVPLAGPRPHPILAKLTAIVNQLTEPFLGPLRRVLPTFGMLDLSPMVALIIIWLIRAVLVSRP